MKFRTDFDPEKILDKNINTKFYSIGSCFANMVAEKLKSNKIEVLNNPFGIIYNPISIFELLNPSTDFLKYMVENDGIWYNYKFHSELRNSNKELLQNKISQSINHSVETLKKTDVIIITLGTAFVYKLTKNNEIIANCHKIAQKHFKKELLSINEIINSFNSFYNTLKSENKSVNIILTVSPVRHIKDTISLNTVSKSILRVACHQLQEMYKNVSYFPAYEIMMDDLRDYRYYKNDLLHPTDFAEQYIWGKFKTSIFNKKTIDLIHNWEKIKISLAHKPFNPTSEKHQIFLKKQLEKLEKINNKINCYDEIENLKRQME